MTRDNETTMMLDRLGANNGVDAGTIVTPPKVGLRVPVLDHRASHSVNGGAKRDDPSLSMIRRAAERLSHEFSDISLRDAEADLIIRIGNGKSLADAESESREILNKSREFAGRSNNSAAEDAVPTFSSYPQPLDSARRSISQFNFGCLPDAISGWCGPAATVIGCPPDFLAIQTVALIGSLIGPRVRLRPWEYSNWFVVPNLYTACVGLPSSKKSPAQDEVRKPLIGLQAAANKAYDELRSRYELDLAFYQKTRSKIISAAETADQLRSRIGAIQEPQQPIRRRYELNDATSIKTLMILSENPNGTMLSVDELTGWMRTLDADYEASGRSRYLELWKGAVSTSFDRADGREVEIRSGTITIAGGIQPSKLQRYVGEAYSEDHADGFLQRFLFAYPDKKVGGQKKPTSEDMRRLQQGFSRAKKLIEMIAINQFGGVAEAPNGDVFLEVAFTEEAQILADRWQGRTMAAAEEIEASDAPFAAYLLKLPKSCFAIALIFHVIECIDKEYFPQEISANTLEKAIDYIKILESHARRVFALGENRIFALAATLVSKIRESKLSGGFTAHQIKRKAWSGLTKPQDIHDVLALLVEYGYLLPYPSRIGRGTLKYAIHPSIEKGSRDALENSDKAGKWHGE